MSEFKKGMMVDGPRICGRAGQISDGPPEAIGKWTFEVSMAPFGGGEPEPVFQCGEWWDTKEEALVNLRKAVQIALEVVQEKIAGKATGDYLDLKSNTFRNFRDEN